MCSSRMKRRAEWYDTCLAVTRSSAANGYRCWWAPLHSASRVQLFWSLVLLFPSPPPSYSSSSLPCFLSPCHIRSQLRREGAALRYLLMKQERAGQHQSNDGGQRPVGGQRASWTGSFRWWEEKYLSQNTFSDMTILCLPSCSFPSLGRPSLA